MKKWIFRFYLILTLLESGLAFYLQFTHNNQLSTPQPLFTALSQAAIVFLGLITVGVAVVLFLDFWNPAGQVKLWEMLENRRLFWGIVIFFIIVSIESGQTLLFLRADLLDIYYPFYLKEIIYVYQWALVVSLQTLVILLGNSFFVHPPDLKISTKSWLLPLVLMTAILTILLASGTGYIPNSSQKDFNVVGIFTTPNSPLPFVQVVVVCLFVSGGWLLLRLLGKRWKIRESGWVGEALTFLLLWVITFRIWGTVPISPNYFLDEPRPPNYQYNVSSDSIFYESQAHRLLVGEKFTDDVSHPLYSYFLSILHTIGGEHYQDIYLLQIAILAVMPFLMYKLVSLLHNKYAGWLSALFFAIREYNALNLSDTITLSSVQLLMTESVAVLCVMLFLYLLSIWITDVDNRKSLSILIGSLIGFLALIRVEMLSLAIVFCLIAMFLYWKKWKMWLYQSMMMFLALLMLTLPWMTRNWYVTGDFYLNKGSFFKRTLQSYTDLIFRLENTAPLQEQATTKTSEPELPRINKIWLLTKSSFVESFLYLPSNHQPLAGVDNYFKYNPNKQVLHFEQGGMFSDNFLTGYVKTLPYWQNDWDGSITSYSILPITIVLGLLSAGFVVLWKKNRLLAITPFLVISVHILISAFFLRSGGRYIQVVDWIALVYFGIGTSLLCSQLIGLFAGPDITELIHQKTRKASKSGEERRVSPKLNGYLIAGAILIALFGSSMPLIELLSEPQYTQGRLTGLVEELSESYPGLTDLAQGQVMLYGKAIYPGYFESGENLLDDRSGQVPDATHARIMFYLVGLDNIWVSLPLGESPDYFPHGVDVIILGEYTRNKPADLEQKLQPYFLANQIFIIEDDGSSKIYEISDRDSME